MHERLSDKPIVPSTALVLRRLAQAASATAAMQRTLAAALREVADAYTADADEGGDAVYLRSLARHTTTRAEAAELDAKALDREAAWARKQAEAADRRAGNGHPE